jgi:hypothetical protein
MATAAGSSLLYRHSTITGRRAVRTRVWVQHATVPAQPKAKNEHRYRSCTAAERHVRTYAGTNVNVSSQPFRYIPVQTGERASRVRNEPSLHQIDPTTLSEPTQMMRPQRLRASSALCAAMRSTIGYLVLNVWTTACRRVAASWTRP